MKYLALAFISLIFISSCKKADTSSQIPKTIQIIISGVDVDETYWLEGSATDANKNTKLIDTKDLTENKTYGFQVLQGQYFTFHITFYKNKTLQGLGTAVFKLNGKTMNTYTGYYGTVSFAGTDAP